MVGQERLGMKLNARNRIPAMPDRHGNPVFGPCLQNKTFRYAVSQEGMVPGPEKRVGQTLEEPFTGMEDLRGFPMHANGRSQSPASEYLVDTLHAQADAEQRDSRPEGLDDSAGDPRVSGAFGPWGDDDAVRRERLRLLQRNRIVPIDQNFAPRLSKSLGEIEGEGVVVVDYQDSHGTESTGFL